MGNQQQKTEVDEPTRKVGKDKFGGHTRPPGAGEIDESIPDPKNGRAQHLDQGNGTNCVRYSLSGALYEDVFYK